MYPLAFILLMFLSTCLRADDKTVLKLLPDDTMARLQRKAINQDRADFGHWGINPQNYNQWTTHSNRLVPVYLFGADANNPKVGLTAYTGHASIYRSEDKVKELYGRLPQDTVCEDAEYLDQTQIATIQRAAAAAGKKYVFLVIFDGMDWTTTRAAAIRRQRSVNYQSGRGTGMFFQNYDAEGTSQFGLMVTSPHNSGGTGDVDQQLPPKISGVKFGGYDPKRAGFAPWSNAVDLEYLISQNKQGSVHAYTDSAASATSMAVGIKTYNNAIGVDITGTPVISVAHEFQENGWAVGVVSSVPISHATPASAYAHNVSRKDYQDLSRDLLGLTSVSHPTNALLGMDVVVGGGFGRRRKKDVAQGENYLPGNMYLADQDLAKVDVKNGGKYVTAVRTPGKSGSKTLQAAAVRAAQQNKRLLGFYGVGQYSGHLPFATANGDYQPVQGQGRESELYSVQDLDENPTLAEMTTAALTVLGSRKSNFWLLVEAGDVDWANHDNNLDNSIGAVNSGDFAVRAIADWVESHSNWEESLMIVTADHGHLLVLTQPELLIR